MLGLRLAACGFLSGAGARLEAGKGQRGILRMWWLCAGWGVRRGIAAAPAHAFVVRFSTDLSCLGRKPSRPEATCPEEVTT